MNRKQNYEQEMTEIIKLRKEGFSNSEIAELIGKPRGTVSARISRYNNAHPAEELVIDERKTTPAHDKPAAKPSLDQFQPRDMIKHLYNLGYRIKDNSLYVMTLQKVNIQSVLSE